MATPEIVTFTGLDERTDMDRVRALSLRFRVEWGVLYSPSRQGKEPRYPNQETLDRIHATPDLVLAAHLCGNHTRKLMEGIWTGLDLDRYHRSQINHSKPVPEVIEAMFKEHAPHIRPITQHRELTFPDYKGIDFLYDCSGGRGDLPNKGWPEHPGAGRFVGYAGGLNPENVAEQVAAMNPRGVFWIDMESGVRTDDWLDLDKCEAVLTDVFD